MKHTYNNWSCKIFEGFYESAYYNSDELYWMSENDKEDGLLKENEYYEVDDWTGFKKDVATAVTNNLINNLSDNDIIQDIKLKDIYSPKYYNYETDSLILNMKLNLHKLKKYCFKTYKDNFNEYLKMNFTSYDGFISYISNNINDFILDYNSKTTPNDRELNVMIEYYLLSQIYESTDPKDFEDYDTSYHFACYDNARDILYNYLVKYSDDEATENELEF